MSAGQDGAVERHLVGVAVAARVHLQPVEVVAGLEVDDPALGVQPVEPRLARHAAVLGPDDALGDAVGQQRRRRARAPGRRRSGSRSARPGRRSRTGLPCASAHSWNALVRLPKGSPVFGLTGPPEGVLPLVGLATLQDERVRGAPDEVRGPVLVLTSPSSFLRKSGGLRRNSASWWLER